MSVEELKTWIEQQHLDFQDLWAELTQAQALVDAQAPAADQPGVGSVAVRLPTFWSAFPDLWFTQVEASFDNGV